MRRRFVILSCVLLASLAGAANAGPAGDLDPTFSGDGLATTFTTGALATGVAIDAEGRIVVAGYTIDGAVDVAVARYLPDGTLDVSFSGDGRARIDLGGSEFAFDVVVDTEDRPVLAGKTSDGLHDDVLVMRLTDAGELDPAFASGTGWTTVSFGKPFQSAGGVALTPTGKIIVGGYTSVGTTSNTALARLRDDGSLDPTFGGDGRVVLDLSAGAEQATAVQVATSGRIFAAGHAEAGLVPRFVAVKLLASGRRDTGFGGDGVATANLGPGADVANALALTSNGKVVLAGRAADGGSQDWGVVRFDADGVLDARFHRDGIRLVAFPGPNDEAFAVVASDGGLWIAGRARGTSDDLAVVRLRGGGGIDTAFSNDGLALVDAFGKADAARGLALDGDGRAVLAGEVTNGSTARFGVARLLTP
jgi:uncharacterized delta-60 repeat protein